MASVGARTAMAIRGTNTTLAGLERCDILYLIVVALAVDFCFFSYFVRVIFLVI